MALDGAAVRGLDRLTARVLDTATRGCGARFDAYKIDRHFFIDIDLPGTDPAGVGVTRDRDLLTVRAERRPGHADGIKPQVSPVLDAETLDTDRLVAAYENGVLTVSIPVTSGFPTS